MSAPSWQAGPLLSVEPFLAWVASCDQSPERLVGDRDDMLVRALRRVATQRQVREGLVERIGLVVAGDPRLAAQLYPELDW